MGASFSEKSSLPGPFRRDGERVQTSLESAPEGVVDEAMTCKPALADEGLRHDINTEMRLAPLAPAAMPSMLLGFVRNAEVTWPQARFERLGYPIGEGHRSGKPFMNRAAAKCVEALALCIKTLILCGS